VPGRPPAGHPAHKTKRIHDKSKAEVTIAPYWRPPPKKLPLFRGTLFMTLAKYVSDADDAHKCVTGHDIATLSSRWALRNEGYCFTIIPWLAAAPFLLMFVVPFILYGGDLNFRTPDGVYHISKNNLHEALLICASWLLLVAISAWLCTRCFPKRSAPEYWRPFEAAKLFLLLYAVGIPVFVFHQLFRLPLAFENLVHIISISAYLALALGISLSFDHRRETQPGILSFERILTCSLFCVLTLLPIVLGKAAEVAYASIVLIAVLSITRVQHARRYPAMMLAGSLVAAAMLVKTPVRQLFHEGTVYIKIDIDAHCFPRLRDCLHRNIGQPQGTSFSSWFDGDAVSFSSYDPNFNKIVLPQAVSGGTFHYVLGRIVHRLNHLGVLAHAVSLSPDVIPFWGWKTYEVMPYVLIPRAVWPEKPQAGFANLFGRRYQILEPADMETTANIDPVTEAWISGGWLAIALSSVGLGALFGGLLGWLRRGGDQEIRFLTSIVIAINVTCFESEVALIVGNLLQGLAFWGAVVVIFCLLTRWRRAFIKSHGTIA